MNEPRSALSVGEVAKRTGVPISTVHFYEAKGLIEGWRSPGNQRRYPRAVLRRIAVVRVAQRAGISLSALKTFLDTIPPNQALTQADWHRLTQSWQDLINEKIAALRQLRDQIGSCIGCGCLSLADCPLRNPGDSLASKGPGAHLLR